MTEHVVNLNNTFPNFEKILKDNLDNYMSNDSVALTKKIKKNIGSILLNYGFQKLKNSSEVVLLTGANVNDTELLAYSNCSSIVSVRKNIDCPPLGSPVIVDNILVREETQLKLYNLTLKRNQIIKSIFHMYFRLD